MPRFPLGREVLSEAGGKQQRNLQCGPELLGLELLLFFFFSAAPFSNRKGGEVLPLRVLQLSACLTSMSLGHGQLALVALQEAVGQCWVLTPPCSLFGASRSKSRGACLVPFLPCPQLSWAWPRCRIRAESVLGLSKTPQGFCSRMQPEHFGAAATGAPDPFLLPL